MKLFGKRLFKYKKKIEPNELYDFAQHGLLNAKPQETEVPSIQELIRSEMGKPKKKKRGRPKKNQYTPHELYEMKALNDNEFSIEVDPTYLSQQINAIKEKLGLYPKNKLAEVERQAYYDFGGGRYGKKELESILIRLENRKKIDEFKKIIDKYPHTTSALIARVATEHTNLVCHQADNFIPDFPNEAVKAMKEYNQMCQDLCGKNTWFYVMADKKDFEKTLERRDPILFAQSPFGHFWQILGAWDDEMIHLADL